MSEENNKILDELKQACEKGDIITLQKTIIEAVNSGQKYNLFDCFSQCTVESFDILLKLLKEHENIFYIEYSINFTAFNFTIIDSYSYLGRIEYLRVWVANGKSLPYSNCAFDYAVGYGRLNITKFWLQLAIDNECELKYSVQAVDYASSRDDTEMLEWIYEQSQLYPHIIKFIYSELALSRATQNGKINCLKFWFSSNLELKYSIDTFKYNGRCIGTIPKEERIEKIQALDLWKEAADAGKVDLKQFQSSLPDMIISLIDNCLYTRLYDKYVELFGNEENLQFPGIMDKISSEGTPQLMQWLYDVNMKLYQKPPVCTTMAIDNASALGKVDNLELWLKWHDEYKLELLYSGSAIFCASANGYVNVLEFWKQSGLELKYTEEAIDNTFYLNVLHWWFNSGLELKYTDNVVLKIIDQAKCLLGCCQHQKSISEACKGKAYYPDIKTYSDIIPALYRYALCDPCMYTDEETVETFDKDKICCQYIKLLKFWYHRQDKFGDKVKEILQSFDLLTPSVLAEMTEEMKEYKRVESSCLIFGIPRWQST
jgi:hypothetical protein